MLAGYYRFQTQICLLMVCICILPTGAGQYSDIAYIDATMTPSATESQAVDINSNSTYIASAYDGMVAIHDVDTLDLIGAFPVGSDVLDVQFSPDGLLLAFSRSGSSADTDTIQIIDIYTLQLTSKQYGSNSHSDMIQWSPDGTLLAVPNSNNGVDILRVADMEVERTLNGEHNTRVTCIAFSSQGSYILTGDESGRLVMWETLGNPTDKVLDFDSEIKACGFDNVDERFAILTEGGELTTWTFSGGAISSIFLDGGVALNWSSDNSAIHVLEDGISPRVLTVDSNNLEISVSIYLAHQALDFALKENAFGTREMVFVATNTGHIAVYGAMSLPEGYGENGADLDGDNIPDTSDDDDDGDAISDQIDKNCPAADQSCSKTPNIDTIRGVDISINSTTFIIRDTYTLDAQTSSVLRNLSRRSLISDIQLSQDETNFLAQTICHNMNENHYVSSWENVILLSTGQLQDGKVECQIKSGMTLTAQNDHETHVAVTYILTFNLSETMTYPFEFVLQSQPSATDTSLAQHAQMHPIDLTAQSTNSETIYWSPWWVVSGELTLTLEEKVESEPGMIREIFQFMISYPVLFLPILGLIVAGFIIIIRTKNSIDLGGDDDSEFLQQDDGTESDSEMPEEDEDEEPDKSQRRAVRRKQNIEENKAPIVERRKAKSIPYNTDGPITKVKRKRLDSNISKSVSTGDKARVSKRKVATKTQTDEVVKTRRVVTYSDEEK